MMGLSALECMLDEEVPNDKFREKGPRSFGYFVSETNKDEPDLTQLISTLLKLIDDN